MKLESASVSAEMLNYEFDTKNLVSLVISGAVGVWYLLKKVGGWAGLHPPPLPPATPITDGCAL